MSIQRYYFRVTNGDGALHELVPFISGPLVKYADHAAEVARLSKPSPAVARLVEACKELYPRAMDGEGIAVQLQRIKDAVYEIEEEGG